MINLPPPKNNGIDICVVTYNHERFITTCIDSILRQTSGESIRIWVHDDCSTDKTAEIVTSFASRHPGKVNYFRASENLFSKSAFHLNESIWRNFADFVTGSYIGFIDGDDFWRDESKIETQLNFFSLHQDYSTAFHDVFCTDEAGSPIASWIPENFKRDYSQADLQTFNYAFLHNSALLFRNQKSVITAEALLSANGDMLLPHYLGGAGKTKYLDTIKASGYRQNSKGAWSSKTDPDRALAKLHFSSLMVSRLISQNNAIAALTQVNGRVLPATQYLLRTLKR